MGGLVAYVVIIEHTGGSETPAVPLLVLAHSFYHLTTDHITLFLPPAHQFHVVDPNNRNFQRVLVNNTFFHAETAENHLPTVPGESVHEKRVFIYISSDIRD